MRVTLNYDYLRYDVEQMVERYSQARIDDAEKRYKANLRSENANEADMIRRLIVSAAGRLRQTLAGYLRIEIEEDDEATSDLGAESIWEFDFKPSVRADVNAMAVVMHHITVRYAMASWCSMQNFLTEAGNEIAEADRYEEELKRGITRLKPIRPCLHKNCYSPEDFGGM
jgi:hypothetical protein